MSIYVLNIATMLGLALAIDYSLFIVSRYREELRRGRTVGEAVERAVATSGKAVMFSGIAVAIGLSGLLLFEAPAIRSIGIAGALVVISSVFFALTFLPACWGCSARGSTPCPWPASRAVPPGRRSGGRARTSRWERVALSVMKHPIKVIDPDAGDPAHRRHPVHPHGPGRARRRGLPARRRESRRLRRLADRIRPRRDDADRHPRRRRRVPHRRRDHRGDPAGTPPSSTPSTASIGSRARSRISDPATGCRCRRNRSPRCTPCPTGQPAGRPRRAARPVRPREHGPARRHQPARAVVARRRRTSSRSSGPWTRATASRPRSAERPRAATTSSCRRRSERPTPSA